MPMLPKYLYFQRFVLCFPRLVSWFVGYWFGRGEGQMVIIEANGGFHLKGYSSVSFKNGEPLQKLKADGTPLRVQQSVLLARKNEQFPSKTHCVFRNSPSPNSGRLKSGSERLKRRHLRLPAKT